MLFYLFSLFYASDFSTILLADKLSHTRAHTHTHTQVGTQMKLMLVNSAAAEFCFMTNETIIKDCSACRKLWKDTLSV